MIPAENSILLKLNNLIDENLENPNFSIDDICRELGLSRSQLHRLVKEHFQLSTSLYIRQRRMLKAKELLDSSDLKIAEVAYRIGIDSPQSFSRYFTEHFGISPTEYRKNKSESEEEITSDPGNQPEHDLPKELLPEPEVSNGPTDVSKPKSAISRLYLWAGAIVLLVVSGFYIWQKTTASANVQVETSVRDAESSIAVLPFKNLGTPQTAFFADGLMEQVHSSLALMEGLRVISKNSSFLFRDSKKTIPVIAAELQVGYILGGTVRQIDKRVSVNVELVKASEDKVVWSKTYEGEIRNAIAFMNKAAKEIAGELNEELSQAIVKKIDKVHTQNLEAYNEYLQGKQLLSARTKEKLEASVLKFDRALALDPNFADAYAYKASAYFLLGSSGFMDLPLSFKMTEQNALTAIRMEADNGLAYASLANVYREQNKWEQAITTYRIALKYSPNDAQVNYWYSLALRAIGKLDEALQYSTKAVSLDPLYPVILGGHLRNCSYANKPALVKEAIQKGEIMFNDSYIFHWAVGYHYIHLGDYPQALRTLTKAHQLNPSVKGITALVVYTQACLGQLSAVNTYLDSLPPTPDNYTYFATVYAGLKDKEKCLNYLERMAASGTIPVDMKVSPFFQFLHDDPRFTKLLQQFGLLDGQLQIK